MDNLKKIANLREIPGLIPTLYYFWYGINRSPIIQMDLPFLVVRKRSRSHEGETAESWRFKSSVY